MKLVLVRHGVSAHNVGNLISGGESNPDLSKSGIAEVEKISKSIDEDKIDIVYASPLIRAKKTANILTKGRKVINLDDRLTEMKFGSWEGTDVEPLYRDCPDAFDFMGMIGKKYTKYAQGAESYDDLVARCSDFMSMLCQTASNKTVLVVCHGFTIRGLMAAIFKLDSSEFTAQGNVTFTEINFDEKNNWNPRLMSFNRRLPAYYALKER